MDSEETFVNAKVKNASRRTASNESGQKGRVKAIDGDAAQTKRRCVSTACIACRKRKSKCDGNLPSCAACASVYNTECVYDPHSDHRRKGVYKKDIDNLKTRNTTLQTLIQAIIHSSEDEAIELVKQIRSSNNLDKLAEDMVSGKGVMATDQSQVLEEDSDPAAEGDLHRFEKEVSGKMGALRLENDTTRFIGGTSNLLHDNRDQYIEDFTNLTPSHQYSRQEDAIRSWTTATENVELILHLLNTYFTWHYAYFTVLSKHLFLQDFYLGKPVGGNRSNAYCTALLVNAILAVGCHFTSWEGARAIYGDPSSAGDHFFKEAKRLFVENDEYESPRLTTVQALAIMSVREAGCARETKGWVYSGMSFRMACDLGLDVRSDDSNLSEFEIDARRITFWGCFLIDKCWSNYLGRPPQLPLKHITAPKFEVFPFEDADVWSPWTDTGVKREIAQPARTRAVALQISHLCEISNDIMFAFYCAGSDSKKMGKQGELKQLIEIHARLDAWRKQIPSELDAHEGQLPHVLTMHMFFHLLYIHLFRPFLKYNLPAKMNPRRICTHAAVTISELIRMYRRTYSLQQICNVVVYIAHAATTIHLLNLPDENAQCDIVDTIQGIEEIAEHWPCARKALLIIGSQVRKWNIDLPEDAFIVLQQADENYARAFSPQANSDVGFPLQLSPLSCAAQGLDQQHSNQGSIPLQQSAQPKKVMPDMKTSMDDITGHFAEESSQGYGSAHNLVSSTTADLTPGNLSLPLSHSLIGSSYSGLEDTKDWWLKDQSSIIDQWTSAEAHSNASSLSPDLTGYNWNVASMMTLNEGNHSGSGEAEGNQVGLGEQQHAHDLSYLDFTPDGMYGYHGGVGS